MGRVKYKGFVVGVSAQRARVNGDLIHLAGYNQPSV